MTEADYADSSKLDLKSVKSNYDGVVYMKKFLEYIGAPEDGFEIVKDARIWSMFTAMGDTLRNSFSNDPSSQVQKNRTVNSYFATILFLISVGNEGNNGRTNIRDYGTDIVSSSANSKYNDEIEDLAFDLSDDLKDRKIQNFSELSKSLIDLDDDVKSIGEVYHENTNSVRSGKSVEKFFKSVEKNQKFLENLNKNGGLMGQLNYNNFSTDQIKQLQNHMRQINLLSEELFNKYAEESK